MFNIPRLIPDFVLKELDKLSKEDWEAMLATYAHDHEEVPQVTTVEEAIKHVHTQVENGDPTTNISDTLSIKAIWSKGVHQLS